MKPIDLLIRHADAWHVATHHQFLDAVRDGSFFLKVAHLEHDFWQMVWQGGVE